MGKKKKEKKAQAARKVKKRELDAKAVEEFKKREAGKTPLQSLTIPPEQRHLLDDFPGPKPKPPKKKTKYSGNSNPPHPPPPLLDLIHNFLKDFKYIKAAHGVRTDNQKRPGHNMTLWKWTSEGYPDLMEIFLQWQEQNPEYRNVIGGDDPTPKRTQGMTLGVYGSEQYESKKTQAEKRKTAKGEDEEESGDESEDLDDDDNDDYISLGVEAKEKLPKQSTVSNSLKRKTPPSSSGSNSSDSPALDSSDFGDSESDPETEQFGAAKKSKLSKEPSNNLKRKRSPSSSSMSSSLSSSASSSDSDNEDEQLGAAKEYKLSNKPTAQQNERQDSPSSSSLSSDSSSSSSDSEEARKSSSTAPAAKKAKLNNGNAVGRNKKSSSSSSSASSSSDDSDSDVDNDTPPDTPVVDLNLANGITRSSSDTSSTLPKPDTEIVSSVKSGHKPASAFTFNSHSAPADSDSPSSEEAAITNGVEMNLELDPSAVNGESAPSPKSTDRLVFHAPPSKKAAREHRVDPNPPLQSLPATAQNFKKLKRERIPYSRIPADVEVDDRFSSNAFSGYEYGAGAHQKLSVTRGKGFTKAKQKFKRGTFKGTGIDVEARSIKFED